MWPPPRVKRAAGSPPFARASQRNLEVSAVIWKMKYTKRTAAGEVVKSGGGSFPSCSFTRSSQR